MCCGVLQCVSVLRCVVMWCSVLQCVVVCVADPKDARFQVTGRIAQVIVVCCSVLQVCCSMLHYVAVCCDALWCVAVCGSVLQ